MVLFILFIVVPEKTIIPRANEKILRIFSVFPLFLGLQSKLSCPRFKIENKISRSIHLYPSPTRDRGDFGVILHAVS